tara:strand:- start:9026 stop:10855 length:1830 start_codon:yes stop_codon:yes gene_type:complete
MLVNLKELEWSNMYSYGDNNKLSLDSASVSQLVAPNGVGKSSIALIIQEILYSKNIKGIKKGDIVNRYSKDSSWNGSILFEVNNKEYKVSVSRKGTSSKVILLEEGIDISEHKIPDTYKKVKEILGMDFEVFSQLTYQSSIDLLEFIKTTDTNRKKFLINLFGLERYTDIGDTLRLRITDKEKDHNILQGELNSVDKFLEETVIGNKKQEEAVPERDDSLDTRAAELFTLISTHEEQSKLIDKNNLLILERDNLRFNIDKKLPETDYTHIDEQLKKYNDEIHINNHDLIENKRKLKGLELADVCHACGQDIDNTSALRIKKELDLAISDSEINITNAEHEVKKYEKQSNEYLKEVKEYNDNQKKIERFEQLSQLINSSLPTEHEDLKELKDELNAIHNSASQQQYLINKIIDNNKEVHAFNVRIDTLSQQKREFLARQQLLEEELNVSKQKLNNLTILRKAFSTSGLVAFKLENLTKELEDTINLYLSELSDGKFQVIFRLTKEKLNVIVRNNGLESPIESVSGGEFNRIQIAILLAIRSILTKLGGSTVNLLFLDEVDGVLDSEGKEKLIDVLQKEISLNIFLISHSFSHPLVHKVEIEKQDNISKII